MNIPSLTSSLIEKDGIWYSPELASVSYPEGRSGLYYELEDSSFWFQHRNQCITSLLKKYAPNETFFDVGGGNGAVTKAVQSAGLDCVLMEPGASAVQNAKARGVKNIICSTFQDTGMPIGTIRSAGLFDVIEHVPDDVSFLKELSELMATDGILLITVPAYSFLWSGEDAQTGHYRRYTLSSLRATVEAAGLEVLYRSYLFSFLPLPIFLFRTLPDYLGRKRDYGEPSAIKNEHSKNQNSSVLDAILNWEQSRIAEGKSVPFGSSCIMVVRKR
jgi:SAM-dependent methyltransferase